MPLSPKYRLSMKTEGGAIGVDSTGVTPSILSMEFMSSGNVQNKYLDTFNLI